MSCLSFGVRFFVVRLDGGEVGSSEADTADISGHVRFDRFRLAHIVEQPQDEQEHKAGSEPIDHLDEDAASERLPFLNPLRVAPKKER